MQPRKTDSNIGLTTKEAKERLSKYGKNVISEVKKSSLQLFLHKFWGVIPWMLEVSIVINLVIGKWPDALLIIALLIFQAVLGFYQENNARNAVALLKKQLLVMAQVLRDGVWQILPASEIVPGDFLHLQAGDVVPADIEISKGDVFVNQSQLTGESMSVEMEKGKTLYAGSLITQGEAFGNVTAIGDKTYYGKTASFVKLAERPPLLQRLALEISRYLLVLDVILVIAAGGVMLVTGTSPASLLTFTLMLLVLSVPVALPAMSTLSATMGVGALAKMGVLTARLSAIEDAAAMDTLCIDKTGTLTENKPRVGRVLPLSNYSENEILYYVARTVDISNQEPINAALKQAAEERKLLKDTGDQDIVFEAFDPKIKSSGAWVNENGKKIHIIKGEPVALAKLTETPFQNIEDKVLELSKNGDRVVAVGIGDDTKVKLAGLISLTDPILTDSKELVSMVKNQGIRVVLLTGDGKKTAQSVAEQVGIIGETAPDDIDYEKINSKDVEKYSVFPRVFPEDKYFIVKAFQNAGHVVGMTGDGVNDAPALKQASVGIATANATDVAKSSAGLILTQPGLTNIPAMIKISRGIHKRMHTWILAMITRKAAIPTFITFGLLIFKEPVITPSLAFLFMLFGDIVTFSLSKDNVVPSTKPDRWDMKPIVIRGSIYALLMFVMSLGVFWFARNIYHMALSQAQTIVFAWLVLVAGQAALYLVRNQKAFWEKPYPSSWLLGATILTFLITAFMSIEGLLMRPIPVTWFGIVLVLAFGYLILGNVANLFLK